MVDEIVCTKCKRKQPFHYVTEYKSSVGFDRGKDYAERQKKIKEKKKSL